MFAALLRNLHAIEVKRWLLDTFERAVSSFVQGAAVFLFTFTAAWDLTAGKALILAGLQSAAAVVIAALALPFPVPTSWWFDAALRTVRTFAGTILAAITAGAFDVFTVSGWHAAIAAGLMAVTAGLKAKVAKHGEAGGTSPASWMVWPR